MAYEPGFYSLFMQVIIKALISTASLIHPIKHTFNFGNVNWSSLGTTFQLVDNLLYHQLLNFTVPHLIQILSLLAPKEQDGNYKSVKVNASKCQTLGDTKGQHGHASILHSFTDHHLCTSCSFYCHQRQHIYKKRLCRIVLLVFLLIFQPSNACNNRTNNHDPPTTLVRKTA